MNYPIYERSGEKTKITILKDKKVQLAFKATDRLGNLINLSGYKIEFNCYDPKTGFMTLQLVKNASGTSLTGFANITSPETGDGYANGDVVFNLTKTNSINHFNGLVGAVCFEVIASNPSSPFGDSIAISGGDIQIVTLQC